MTDLPQLLTVAEVARYLRLGLAAVKRLPIPYLRINARGDRRYRREDIERYLEAMQR